MVVCVGFEGCMVGGGKGFGLVGVGFGVVVVD